MGAHRHDPTGGRWGQPPWVQAPWVQAPTGAPSAHLRIGDAERTEVTTALCRHMAEGRLTEGELEERVTKANAAKTAADLGPLLADLPPLAGAEPTAAATEPPPRRRHRIGGLLPGVVVLIIGGLIAASALHHVAYGLVHVPWFLIAVVIFVAVRRSHRHRR